MKFNLRNNLQSIVLAGAFGITGLIGGGCATSRHGEYSDITCRPSIPLYHSPNTEWQALYMAIDPKKPNKREEQFLMEFKQLSGKRKERIMKECQIIRKSMDIENNHNKEGQLNLLKKNYIFMRYIEESIKELGPNIPL